MANINQNDSFYANNKRTLHFSLTDKDAEPAGPYDLTGKTVRWSLSRQNDDGTYSTVSLLNKISTNPAQILIADPATDGVVDVFLTKEDTAKFSGKYHHELEVIDGDAEPVVVATGTLTILKNIVNA